MVTPPVSPPGVAHIAAREAMTAASARGGQLSSMLLEQRSRGGYVGPRELAERRRLNFSRVPLFQDGLDEEWQNSYNEIIIDANSWHANLPSLIMGVFMLDGSKPSYQAHARRVHARFREHYNISAETVPLLVYDPAAGSQPFRAAHSREGCEPDQIRFDCIDSEFVR